MSEEQIKEALEQEELQNVVDEQEAQEEEHDELELNPVEQRAWDQGWRPEDQFEGNPDNWKTAGEYNLYGEMQEHVREAKAETRRKEAEFDSRIQSLNKLHEAQQAAAINDLKAQQRQAVEEADTAEFDRLQGQIDSHQTIEQAPVDPAKDPLIQAWEDKNPWVNDPDDEKGQQAIALYNIAAGRTGATVSSALAYAEEQLSKLYPSETPTNPRREMPSMTEQSSARPTGRRRSKELTMDDLTASERSEWQKFGNIMFSNEKDYLKAVADARKEK